MSFDLAASLRRLKPEKKRPPLFRRADADLTFVGQRAEDGSGLLFDTTVYIDALQGRRPETVINLMQHRANYHSAIALAELTHSLGRLDPNHRETAAVVRGVCDIVSAMPEQRLIAPSTRAIAEAGIIAGTVSRLRGLPPMQLQAMLNDAILFCQAAERGLTVLTRNIADFDLIQQIAPWGRVLFYRQAP